MKFVKKTIFYLIFGILPFISTAQISCDVDGGGILELQFTTSIDGLLRGNGFCLKPTVLGSPLELQDSILRIIPGTITGQVLYWNGTIWLPAILDRDTSYNGLTDLGMAHIFGGPLVQNTRVHGQKEYNLTFDDIKFLAFEAQRTSGVAYSYMTMGSDATNGFNMVHQNEASVNLKSNISLNYNTGNDISIKNGGKISAIQQYLSGSEYQTDIMATAGGLGGSKVITVTPTTIEMRYLDLMTSGDACGWMVWDTLDSKVKYANPFTAGAGITISPISNVITNTGDLSTTNELQTLSIVGSNLSISSGNTVAIPSGADNGSLIQGTGISITGTAPALTITNTGVISEVDGSITNEGALTVGAGTGTTSIVNSNTSGSTGVTFTAGTGLSIAETGNVITLANTGIITEVDGSITNELQNLSLSGQALSISSGTGVTLPIVGVSAGTGISVSTTAGVTTVTNTGVITEVDGSITNELQTLSTATNTVTLSNSGGSFTVAGAGINTVATAGTTITVTGTEVDGSITNELQNLSLSGQALSISGGTGATLPVVGVSAGTGISVSTTAGVATVTNTGVITEVDGSTTNELQTLSLTGQSLAISAGNNVTLPIIGVSAGTGISVSTTAGVTTVTNTGVTTEVDGSVTNEGDLTVGAGTGATSIINSNTSGSTGVTFTAGTGLSIAESGNVITLANTGVITEVDGLTNNELNTGFGVSGGNLTITDAGGGINVPLTTIAPDQSTTNEIQTLSITGQSLSISAANTVLLPIIDVSAGTGISVSTTSGVSTVTNTGDLSTTNELQTLSLTGQSLAISAGNNVTLPIIGVSAGTGISVSTTAGVATVTNTGVTTEVDGSVTNEGDLTVAAGTGTTSIINSNTSGSTGVTFTAGTGLSIAETGNVITLANTGIITEVDGSITNELQTLSTATNTVTLSNSGGSFTVAGAGMNTVATAGTTITVTGTEVDGSTTNELQNLSLVGQALSISGGTGATLPVVGVSAGTGISVSTTAGVATVTNTGVITEVDGSTTNELQNLSVSGGNLNISGGTGVTLIDLNYWTKTTAANVTRTSGKVGINVPSFYLDEPDASTLTIQGNVSIGAPYFGGYNNAGTNGLLVTGNVWLGIHNGALPITMFDYYTGFTKPSANVLEFYNNYEKQMTLDAANFTIDYERSCPRIGNYATRGFEMAMATTNPSFIRLANDSYAGNSGEGGITNNHYISKSNDYMYQDDPALPSSSLLLHRDGGVKVYSYDAGNQTNSNPDRVLFALDNTGKLGLSGADARSPTERIDLFSGTIRFRDFTTSGNVLTHSGTGVVVSSTPASIVSAGGGITTSTTAGGDLSGTYPNPLVDGLQGVAVSATTPTNGQVLKYNGSAWLPQADANSGGTVTSVAATAGAGISISGSPITTSGTLNITNTAPDQTVSIANGGGVAVSGTYPSFALTATDQSTTNELQTYAHTGTTSYTNTLSNSGGAFTIQAGTAMGVSHSAGTITINNTGDTNANNDINNVQDDGVSMTQRNTLNFVSTSTINQALTDNAGLGTTEIRANIPAGGVGTTELAADAVTGAKILNGTISGFDIANATVATTNLTTTGVSSGTYGSATQSAVINVGTDGRIISASNATITTTVTIGSIQSAGANNGLSLSGTDIRLHAVNGTQPGAVTQTDGQIMGNGTKIFQENTASVVTVPTILRNTSATGDDAGAKLSIELGGSFVETASFENYITGGSIAGGTETVISNRGSDNVLRPSLSILQDNTLVPQGFQSVKTINVGSAYNATTPANRYTYYKFDTNLGILTLPNPSSSNVREGSYMYFEVPGSVDNASVIAASGTGLFKYASSTGIVYDDVSFVAGEYGKIMLEGGVWTITKYSAPKVSVASGTTYTVTELVRILDVPTGASTTTLNLPEIVSNPTAVNTVAVGHTIEISIDRAAAVTINRGGASDLIYVNGGVATATSVASVGGVFYVKRFIAAGLNKWVVQ